MLKKSRLLPLLVFIFSIFSSDAGAEEYTYDHEKSRVSFTLRHLGIATVEGRFKTFSGSFSFDPKNLGASSVNILIQPASVDSGSPTRNEDLRSENFFAAEKYPEIRFESKKSTPTAPGHYKIEGDLTIRGITRSVVFKTELLTNPEELGDNAPVSFRSQTLIKRKDFNLGTGNWLDPLLFITDETLKINLEVIGIPKKENPKTSPTAPFVA